MSARFDASAENLRATLSGITAESRIFMASWYKNDSALSLGSTNTLLHIASDSAGAAPNLRCGISNTLALRIIPNGSTATSSTLFVTADTWVHTAFSYGPYDGNTQDRRQAINGTWDETVQAATLSTAAMNELAIGGSLTGGATHSRALQAEVGVWIGLTTGQEDTILAELQTIHVDKVSIAPDFSWRAHNSGLLVPATGGVTLTQNGATSSSDEPPGLSEGDPPATGTRVGPIIWL